MKESNRLVSNVLLGVAAGAAAGAAGLYLAGQDQRELRRVARRVERGAENAVCSLDHMMENFLRGM